MHPEVSPEFLPFKYKAGKPDRVKKVNKFILEEQEKILIEHAKIAENERNEKATEKNQKGKIYFASIKSKVPKLEQTAELLNRKNKIMQHSNSQATSSVTGTNRGASSTKPTNHRRESGNLASAIGLYKSGQDLSTLTVLKKYSHQLSLKQ